MVIRETKSFWWRSSCSVYCTIKTLSIWLAIVLMETSAFLCMSICPLDRWKIISMVRIPVVFCYIGPVQINLLGTYRCFCVATVRIWATGCFSHVLLQYTLSICYVVYPNLSASHHLFHDCDTFGSEVLLPMQRVTCTVSSRFSNLVILWLHFQKISNIT
jgi:hypothetical protein